MHKKVGFLNRHFTICTLWVIGFVIGFSIAGYITSHSFYAPYLEYGLSGSFGSILISAMLPLLIALLAWALNLDILSDINLLVNSFLYGFCSLYLSRTTGISGGFVHFLFMFSTGSCATLLVYICSVLNNLSLRQCKKLSFGIFFAAIVLCCLDCLVILRFFT